MWRPLTTLVGATFWGRLQEKSLTRLATIASQLSPHTQLVLDVTRLFPDGVSSRALQHFAHELVPALERRSHEPIALVVAPGLAGASLCGTLLLAPTQSPWSVASSLEVALAALRPDDGAHLSSLVAGVVASELAPQDVVHRVRNHLARFPRHGLRESARELRTTTRTMQRALAMAGTSFANERTEVRLELAASLLDGTRYKLQAVAHTVGYDSIPHFAASFRQRFGETPHQFRQRRATSAPATSPLATSASSAGTP